MVGVGAQVLAGSGMQQGLPQAASSQFQLRASAKMVASGKHI